MGRVRGGECGWGRLRSRRGISRLGGGDVVLAFGLGKGGLGGVSQEVGVRRSWFQSDVKL